jgi:hypothetical protein
MTKKILVTFVLVAILLMNTLGCFARGSSGGGRSSSFSSSRSSSFSSSRSTATSMSRPSNSWSFSKPTPVVVTRPSVRPTSTLSRQGNYKPSKQVVVVKHNKTKVVHHYSHGSSLGDMTTLLLLDNILDNNHDMNTIRQSVIQNINTMRANTLKCYDLKGGRSCIEKYVK